MTTERCQVLVGGFDVEVVRKDIQNLHVGVYPPEGRVRVAAPLGMDDEAVRLALVSRLGWIRRQRESFERQERQSLREMVSGESHFVEGHRYRLDVVEAKGSPSVRIVNRQVLAMQVPPDWGRDKREALLWRWYRGRLRGHLPTLLAKWEPRVGVDVAEVRIRRMKTRWGSCNREARRIWLNLELAKKPMMCLEYILVHEMVHFHERNHGDRFLTRMNRVMPNWRHTRDVLNRAPLAHETWTY